MRGVLIAFSTPVFLGLAPIFGKLAIEAGADSFTVAALRTMVAVLLMWSVYLLFFRKYVFIYPAGLIGCIVIGAINGIGSLFYYAGLGLLDASLTQLINGAYLAFAVLLSRISGQKADWRTMLRVLLAIAALVVINIFSAGPVNFIGVAFMLANALMFAGTMILSQYVVYEMPAPTAALYILTTMGVLVTMVWLGLSPTLTLAQFQASIWPIVALGVTTALSRLAMFGSVKVLGGMQTAVFAILEILVAIVLGAIVLGDSLTMGQWVGVVLLGTSILLVRQRDLLPRGYNPSFLVVANMSSVQFQQIAFHRAFGTKSNDNEEGTMGTITTQEMAAIQRMMGAEIGGLDPFPIAKSRKIVEIGDADPFVETRPALRDKTTPAKDDTKPAEPIQIPLEKLPPHLTQEIHLTETRRILPEGDETAPSEDETAQMQEIRIPDELRDDDD